MALKKLSPDIALVLRNQHTMLLTLKALMHEANPADYGIVLPVLLHQIKTTDEAISMNRVKDE